MVTVTLWVPIFTGVNLYPPSSPVVVETEAFVPSFVKVTVAPLMRPPEESETVPKIAPASICANDEGAFNIKNPRQAAVTSSSRPPQIRTVLRSITDPPQKPSTSDYYPGSSEKCNPDNPRAPNFLDQLQRYSDRTR